MNKTSIRHEPGHHRPSSRSRSHNSTKTFAAEPDMIIIPAHESATHDGRYYLGRERKLEYTAFEEIESVPSNLDDELAFQEYADDDPTRLRVSGRRKQA